MTNQQGAPEALRPIQRFNNIVGLMNPEARGLYVRYEDHVAALVEAQQPAPSAAGAVSDEDEALDLLATLFDAWESGTPCYEEPESSDGFLGHAFRLDDEVFHRCADLLNRRRGKQPAPTPQADSAPLAAPADIVVLEAALRAIHQAIDLIGEPDTERLRTVRRVLRGAVVVAEDSTAPQADSQPAPVLDESAARDECKRRWLAEDEDCNLLEAYDRGWKDRAVRAPAGSEVARLRAALVYTAYALHATPQYMLAEGITLIDGDTVRVSRDGWTVEASVNPARATPPDQTADSVQDLQPVHDAVTIDLLNERVAYLESKLKAADSVLEDAARLWDAFIEAWRNEIGVDKIVNIMGGADKLKAVFLDAARKQGGAT